MENSEEIDELLEQYFTIDELKNISSYEKLHYFNIWKNYEMLILLGLNPSLPKFIQEKINRGKETAPTSDDSEGLVQDLHSKVAEEQESKQRKATKEAADSRALVSKTPRADRPWKEKFVVQKQLEHSKNDNGKVDDHYPKRNVLKKVYKELDLITDDKFLYCKDCGREYEGPCPDHGPMTLIADTKVLKDSSVPQWILKTPPNFPSVSSIKKAPRLFPDVYYHTCSRCGQRFTDVNALRRHEKCHPRADRRHQLRTHIAERLYVCNLCPKTFTQKGHLQRHSLVHSSENEHERSVHSESRLYACSVCEKTFDDDDARMRHQRMHSEQQSHCCPHCDRSFSKSGHLKQHMTRLHTLVFLYSCRFCEMGFWTVGELQAHVQGNHLEV